MALSNPRYKILPLRGTYTALNAEVANIVEGEICYATDEDQYYQKEGGVLVVVGATKAQGLLADTAVQPGDNVSELVNDAGYITSAGAPVQSVAGKTGAVSLVKADVGLGNVDNTSDANKPISTATQSALDLKADLVGGLIPTSQIPAIAITEFLGSVASDAAMQALVGQQGDWCLRTDKSVGYVIIGPDPTQLSNWEAFTVPGSAVTSINTQVGDVVLGASDVGAATAAQGVLADSAVQPGDNVSTLTNDAGYITSPDGGDAGTLDGLDSSQFLRSDANDVATGNITFKDSDVRFENTSASAGYWFIDQSGDGKMQFSLQGTGSPEMKLESDGVDYTTAVLTVGDNEVWHEGNDGAGSGLDADLLDGQEGSYYLDYTNFTNTDWVSVTGGINYAGGNVGVGTGVPDEKLHVEGNAKITGDITGFGNITSASTCTFSTTSGELTLQSAAGINVTPGENTDVRIGKYENGLNNRVIFRSGATSNGQYWFYNIDNTFRGAFRFRESTDATDGLTANRVYTFPNKTGVVALTSDVDDGTFWTRNGTDLSPKTSGDSITDIKNISAVSAMTISTASGNVNIKPGGAGNVDIGSFTLDVDNRVLFRSGNAAGNGYRFFDPTNTYYGALNFLSLTDNRIYQFPDEGGTVALTSDIPTNNNQLTNGAGYPVYQQGAWTPSVGSANGDSTHTFGTNVGVWTRVGNMVTIHFQTNVTALGANGTGIAGVFNLPYAFDNSYTYSGTIGFSNGFSAGFNPTSMRSAVSSSYVGIPFTYGDPSSGYSTIGVGRFTASATVSGSISYLTTDTTWTPINGATVS